MAKYDVVAIGNALVDILAHVQVDFIEKHQLNKNVMTLIDEETAISLYNEMPPAREVSGGSAANMVTALVGCGGSSAFIGKVRNDQIGGVFRHDLTATGVDFDTPSSEEGLASGCSYILVTPDAERTMCTYLGAAASVSEDDIDENIIADSKVLYLEGYLWDSEAASKAFHKAIECAKRSGCKVALALSDPYCVGRHREMFLSLLQNDTDILFANEEEILSLFEVETITEALNLLVSKAVLGVITRGSEGAAVVSDGGIRWVPTNKVHNVVDTTGAGDAFAAGFLYGYTQGLDLNRCAEIGNKLGAEIIQHTGARLLDNNRWKVASNQ